jgi:hypothetical protein
MSVFVAIVQEPMAALDGETYVEVFEDYSSAEDWVEGVLKNYDSPDSYYSRDDVNWNIYYRNI